MRVTNTQSKYVILIAFPLQQRLHERSSKFRCTYISCCAVSCSPPQSPVFSHMDLVYTVISYFLKICSSVGVVTRPRTGRPRGGGSFRDRYKIFLSSVQRPDRLWGPISLLCTWYRRPFVREYSGLDVKLTSLRLVTRLKVCEFFFISAPPHSRLYDTEPN